MTVMIEATAPGRWQDLETQVAQILKECGYDVEVQKNVQLAGGDVNIDVWADDHSSPQNIIAVECKHWATPTTKNVVHGFRTVVGDSGANTGLIVSSAGFQEGAVEAAAYSNVRLLNWSEFQAMFAVRWFRQYMSPTLADRRTCRCGLARSGHMGSGHMDTSVRVTFRTTCLTRRRASAHGCADGTLATCYRRVRRGVRRTSLGPPSQAGRLRRPSTAVMSPDPVPRR